MGHYDLEDCVVCGRDFSPLQSNHLQDTCVDCRMKTELERWCIKKGREDREREQRERELKELRRANRKR